MSKQHVAFIVDGKSAMIIPETDRAKYKHLECLKGVFCRPADPVELETKPYLVAQKRLMSKHAEEQATLFESE